MNLDEETKIICSKNYLNINWHSYTSFLLLFDLIQKTKKTKFNFCSIATCLLIFSYRLVEAASPIYYNSKIDNICDYYAAIHKLDEHPECNTGLLTKIILLQ